MSGAKKLRVLHRSAHFLAIDKPFDVVLNSEDPDRVSVHSLMRQQFPEAVNESLTFGFYTAHRLDYSTSGVFLTPLTLKATQEARY